ncbi:Uncharacterized protein DBV15_01699 [Temnothorax longispinosus]|uniref:Uncharacterized protein n=1 Tax=Temnothorax longispinosus TaxID=300112 RepID=A0A4S2L152_9HYME|nr:Uncharacterized protein DBV15_01699 [Temnothorax longispinosus]
MEGKNCERTTAEGPSRPEFSVFPGRKHDIERRICNSSCPGLGNRHDKVAEDTDIKGEGEVIPRRSSEMPEN